MIASCFNSTPLINCESDHPRNVQQVDSHSDSSLGRLTFDGNKSPSEVYNVSTFSIMLLLLSEYKKN